MKGEYIKKEIQDKLSKSELEEAVKLGLSYLDRKFFILASSRFLRIKKLYHKGTISNESYIIECNKITNSILSFLEDIKEEKLFKKNKNVKLLMLSMPLLALLDFAKIKALGLWLFSGIVILVGVNIAIEKYKPTNLDPLEFSKTLIQGHWICDNTGFISYDSLGMTETAPISEFYSWWTEEEHRYNFIFKDRENLIVYGNPLEPTQMKYYINHKGNSNKILAKEINEIGIVITLLNISTNRINVEFEANAFLFNIWLDRVK